MSKKTSLSLCLCHIFLQTSPKAWLGHFSIENRDTGQKKSFCISGNTLGIYIKCSLDNFLSFKLTFSQVRENKVVSLLIWGFVVFLCQLLPSASFYAINRRNLSLEPKHFIWNLMTYMFQCFNPVKGHLRREEKKFCIIFSPNLTSKKGGTTTSNKEQFFYEAICKFQNA